MKLKNNVKLLITCDSGAGAGKTTASKYLSNKFNLKLLTSGLLYRYIAYKLIINKKSEKDNFFLKKIARNINLNNIKKRNLYSPKITQLTSKIAKIKKVRQLLKKHQSQFAKKKLVILEGRDMGNLISQG